MARVRERKRSRREKSRREKGKESVKRRQGCGKCDSQQRSSPVGFLFLKLLPPPCPVLLVVLQLLFFRSLTSHLSNLPQSANHTKTCHFCAGETPLDMCKKQFVGPKLSPKGDPKEVEKLLVEAGGHEKGSWGLMKDRVKDTFSWWGLRAGNTDTETLHLKQQKRTEMQVGRMRQWIFGYFNFQMFIYQSVVELIRPQVVVSSSHVWWVGGPMRHMDFQKHVLRCSFCVLPFAIDIWKGCQFHQPNLWHFMQHVMAIRL